MKTFPVIRDLVCDVSWNYEVNKKIPAFAPKEGHRLEVLPGGGQRRVQEFRKCIECFLCQDVCHVLRDHEKKDRFGGPRFFVRVRQPWRCTRSTTRTGLEILRKELGIGLCNITKCCTEVCPEGITITDNAIIPLKERVVDRHYDPLLWLWRKATGKP